MNNKTILDIYNNLCLSLYNDITSYIKKNNIIIQPDFVKPEVILNKYDDQDLKNSIRFTKILDGEVIRIRMENEYINLSCKIAFNFKLNKSMISLIDVSINRVQLRYGNIGTKLIQYMIDINQLWVREFLNINNSCCVVIIPVSYFSIPFQFKNGFKLQYIIDVIAKWDTAYKLLKLLILLNKENSFPQVASDLKKYYSDQEYTCKLVSEQVEKFYNKIYFDNLQVKEVFIEQIPLIGHSEISRISDDLRIKIQYSTLCNQIANDTLMKACVLQLLQELFVMIKTVEIPYVEGSIKLSPNTERNIFFS